MIWSISSSSAWIAVGVRSFSGREKGIGVIPMSPLAIMSSSSTQITCASLNFSLSLPGSISPAQEISFFVCRVRARQLRSFVATPPRLAPLAVEVSTTP